MEEIKLLDHGYIKLIETWGSDERIIEAARQSTDGAFRGWGPIIDDRDCLTCDGTGEFRNSALSDIYSKCPECLGDKKRRVPGDEKLLSYLYKNGHCYDTETEVLTRARGFVRWSDVRPEDQLGQWDETLGSLVYEAPLELIRQEYQGHMYRVDHGGVDLLVTENHKMFVKQIVSVPGENRQEWSANWSLKPASELDQKSMVRYRKHAVRLAVKDIDLSSGESSPIFPIHDDSRALLRLIGFFIGDGHAARSRANGIEFHLKKSRKIAFLREVCAEVGWDLVEKSHNTYIVQAEDVTHFFREQFYDEESEKHIPGYLLDLNAEDASAMLEGLRASDGTTKRGAWEYSTTSKQVSEAVQLLVLHAGGAAHVGSDGYIYRVMVLSRMLEPVINQGKKNTDWELYDGEVFCAHTRTGVLVVRRHGKIVLSGNSTPFEMAGCIIEVQAPILVFREWQRHRTQSYSELSARYTPLPDLYYVPTFERVMLNSGGSNKQAGRTDDAEDLTEGYAAAFRMILEGQYKKNEELYQQALKQGVPKELARCIMPVGHYSRMRASANLRNWMGFLSLRQAPNAQWEIRQYADALNTILTPRFPRSMGLFNEGEK